MSVQYPIQYAVSELVGFALLVLVAFMLLIRLMYTVFANPAKSRVERVMEKCLLVWWMALFTVAIIGTVTWTDITYSFPESCYNGDGPEYCESCDWTVKAQYLIGNIMIPAEILFFYQINTKFQSKTFVTRLRRWMFIVAAVYILTIFEVFGSSHIGFVQELSGCGRRQYSVCELSDLTEIRSAFISTMLIPTNLLLYIATFIAFNLAFIWRATKIWKQSCLEYLDAIKTFKSLESATNSIIRHCILTLAVTVTSVVQLLVFTFGGDYYYLASSVWLWMWIGSLFLMFIPLMDSKYEMVFGRLHRHIFRKWMDRNSTNSEFQQVQIQERLAEIEQQRVHAKLSRILEDDVRSEIAVSTRSERTLSNSPSPFTVQVDLDSKLQSTMPRINVDNDLEMETRGALQI